MKTILKVLVGSRAHGLNREDSDYDYRGVFVEPTSKILSINGDPRNTSWVEGDEDNTQYEIGNFLHLATKCNPSILEVLVAPFHGEETTEEGHELRKLFDVIWEPKRVVDAFCGYSKNQEKKFLVGREGRPQKFCVAYIRSLWMAKTLLTTGKLPIEVSEELRPTLLRWKNAQDVTPEMVGEVMSMAARLKDELTAAYEAFPDKGKKCDMDAVNSFLLKVRKANW
jgi:hypothetical protein